MKSDLFYVPIAILLIVSGCFCSSSLGLFPSGLMIYFFTVTFGFLSFCFLCICCRFVVTIGSYILTYNNDVCVCIYIYTQIYIYINSRACMLSCFSHVWLCTTMWTIARQASLSMGYCTQKHWSGLPCPLPGDLPDLGITPTSLSGILDHWDSFRNSLLLWQTL